VFVNLTISVDDELLRRTRDLARRRGVSLQDLLRDYLRSLAGEESGEVVAEELLDLMDRHGGHSGGRRIGRAAAYDGRV